jgi:ABC-type proline/glycine betaine transport system permease subunit
MSGRTVSVIALALLVLIGLALELAARRGHDRATAAQAVASAMRTTPGRAMVLTAWVWLGVHFLAR